MRGKWYNRKKCITNQDLAEAYKQVSKAPQQHEVISQKEPTGEVKMPMGKQSAPLAFGTIARQVDAMLKEKLEEKCRPKQRKKEEKKKNSKTNKEFDSE
jgi:hypothetical protein